MKIGILDYLRSKRDPDRPAAAMLNEEFEAWLKKLDENTASTQAVEAGLALDTIKNGGKASADKLEQLEKERRKLQRTVDALRTELETALKAEADEAWAARWAVSKQKFSVWVEVNRRLNDIVDTLTDLYDESMEKYEDAYRSLPVVAGDFQPRVFVDDLPGFITSRARCRSGDRVRLSRDLEHLTVVQLAQAGANDIAARAEEQAFIALRALTPAAPAKPQRPQPVAEAAAVLGGNHA